MARIRGGMMGEYFKDETMHEVYWGEYIGSRSKIPTLVFIKTRNFEEKCLLISVFKDDGLRWRSGADMFEKIRNPSILSATHITISRNHHDAPVVICAATRDGTDTNIREISVHQFIKLRGLDYVEQEARSKRMLVLAEV